MLACSACFLTHSGPPACGGITHRDLDLPIAVINQENTTQPNLAVAFLSETPSYQSTLSLCHTDKNKIKITLTGVLSRVLCTHMRGWCQGSIRSSKTVAAGSCEPPCGAGTLARVLWKNSQCPYPPSHLSSATIDTFHLSKETTLTKSGNTNAFVYTGGSKPS